ncbi:MULTISPECIES: hypothetical protein [Enterococcus]|uniref:hypothetical protein n=1 Tax=Enterococcus TaxID=1350 RepID=UPI0015C4F37B|nr:MULTISPECIES: hypothetical protein [Enterococcus]EME8127428.1 hypothetical protein [Enterococcus faecium]MDT6294745.1 hypothetical protein [Enterococcus faecium]
MVSGTALIGSGNTATVVLIDDQGEKLVEIPIDIILIAGQSVADFHSESLETSKPAVVV